MGRRKRKRQKRQLELSNQEFTDVPISFAADSTGKISGRLGKSIMNAKLLDKQNDASNEEFEGEDDEETHESIVTPDVLELEVSVNTKIEKMVPKCKKIFEEKKEGIMYPLDLWEALSWYILPESVATFAQICRYSNFCVQTPKFWLNMYQNFAIYAPMKLNTNCDRDSTTGENSELPKHLSPERINKYCQGNLRIQVVRALFYTYEPLRTRLNFKHAKDPHSIIGKICHGAWISRKKSNCFRFLFKLSSEPIKEFPRISTFDSIVHDSWEDIDTEYMGYSPDISHSWEEDCEILHLDSNVYSYLPGELIGKKVLDVVITSTGEGFRYRKVCIIFGQPHIRAEKDFRGKMNLLTPHTSTVTIDQCRHVRILDWYHPLYLGFDEK